MSFRELYINSRPGSFGGVSWPREKTLVSIVGIPLDTTATYKPGTRFAPDSLRIASRNIELYSMRNQVDLEEYGIYDEGDLVVVQGDVTETLSRIERVVRELVSEERLYIFIGGEHTITYGIVKGLLRRDLGVVVFDAHLDLRDEYTGLKYCHATVMKRVSELTGPGSIFYIGTRAVSGEELREVARLGHEYVTIHSIKRLGPREVVRRILKWGERFRHIYVSIDMDVLDPSVAPGVGTPEPEGLTSWEFLEILNEVIDERVVSVDLVEINPLNDPSEITSMLGARTVVEVSAKYISLKNKRHRVS